MAKASKKVVKKNLVTKQENRPVHDKEINEAVKLLNKKFEKSINKTNGEIDIDVYIEYHESVAYVSYSITNCIWQSNIAIDDKDGKMVIDRKAKDFAFHIANEINADIVNLSNRKIDL